MRFNLRANLCRRHDRAAAFTLIELVLVIATVAVLSAIAIPRYSAALSRYQVDLAAKRIVADFALARTAARASGAGQLVTFGTPANGYTLAGLPSADKRTGDYVVRLGDEPFKVAISSPAFGTPAASSVRFNRYGYPDNAAGGSVVVTSGRFSRTVVLDPVTGRAEVQ